MFLGFLFREDDFFKGEIFLVVLFVRNLFEIEFEFNLIASPFTCADGISMRFPFYVLILEALGHICIYLGSPTTIFYMLVYEPAFA